ncbi:alpha/beta fold hydrolase [Microbacterium rhizomatis]|uniref:Alpha/beta fold hydrolase n=1 Tax=Microbacterium rhizomatis TaxID=1631477 RepID=A0A5J5J799_9MICO|nr:alpha/beta fold hydrolase [Microbacterium rhizomatis]KAA9110748.1 alpha/beta fold hydrolase [Microbacterium rhizomatis]
MTPAAQTVVFLHGIGAGPDSWNTQIAALPEGFTGFAPTIAGLTDADDHEFSLTAAATAIRDELDRRSIDRAHLCGLSLGGMVATRFAIDYPERVASLVLSGSQVHPNPALMKVQNAIMRILPARVVAQPGMSKQRMLAVLRAVGQTDFRAELAQISAPTLVLCGLKDRPNIPAARELAGGIAGAELQLVPGAGHEWNVQQAEEFSTRLNAFYLHQKP